MKKINLPLLAAALPLLSFYGYLIAYTYEASYLAAYDIPSFLVQISLNTIFLATIYASVILAIGSVVIIKFLPILNSFEKKLLLYPLMLFFIYAGIIIPAFAILFPDNLSLLLIIIIILFILIIFIEFLIPIIKSRTLKNIREQILADRLARNKNKPNTSITIKNEYYKLAFIIIAVLFITSALTSFIANLQAQLNSQYYVFNNKGTSYALIRTYGEEKLAIKYKDKKLISGELYIFRSNDLKLKKEQLILLKKKSNFLPIN